MSDHSKETSSLAICYIVPSVTDEDDGRSHHERVHAQFTYDQAALQTIQAAHQAGHQIVVVDSRSTHQFKDVLREQEIPVIHNKDASLLENIGWAIYVASKFPDTQTIAVTSTTQQLVAASCKTLVQDIVKGKANVVLPLRSPLTLKQIPTQQIFAEQSANNHLNQVIYLSQLGTNAPYIDFFSHLMLLANTQQVLSVFDHEEMASMTQGMHLNMKNHAEQTWESNFVTMVFSALYHKLTIQTHPLELQPEPQTSNLPKLHRAVQTARYFIDDLKCKQATAEESVRELKLMKYLPRLNLDAFPNLPEVSEQQIAEGFVAQVLGSSYENHYQELVFEVLLTAALRRGYWDYVSESEFIEIMNSSSVFALGEEVLNQFWTLFYERQLDAYLLPCLDTKSQQAKTDELTPSTQDEMWIAPTPQLAHTLIGEGKEKMHHFHLRTTNRVPSELRVTRIR